MKDPADESNDIIKALAAKRTKFGSATLFVVKGDEVIVSTEQGGLIKIPADDLIDFFLNSEEFFDVMQRKTLDISPTLIARLKEPS